MKNKVKLGDYVRVNQHRASYLDNIKCWYNKIYKVTEKDVLGPNNEYPRSNLKPIPKDYYEDGWWLDEYLDVIDRPVILID